MIHPLIQQRRLIKSEIPFTPKVQRTFERSLREAQKLGQNYIAPEHLILSLAQDQESVAAKVLERLGISPTDLHQQLIQVMGKAATVSVGNRQGQTLKRTKLKALEEFGTDLTKLAAEGKTDPVVGRCKEIERVIQILGRRTKNNPLLMGEPGVGKTAIAEGLAQRIINQDVPEDLQDRRVISLNMGLLMAGARFRGDFEERLTQVMNEVRQSQNIILVIDEMHTLVKSGSIEGGIDAANLLKPALARGELQCIGATTLEEYRQHIQQDAALERRLQPVQVEEPTVTETVEILYGLRSCYEQHHRLTITDAALTAAAKLSDRYITDRYLPDKAIDLMDEAGARVRLRNSRLLQLPQDLKQEINQLAQAKIAAVESQDFAQARELRDREVKTLQAISLQTQVAPQPSVVDVEDIAQVLAAWTGIPVNRLTESESALLLHLEVTLHQRLVGQSEAVTAVSRAMRRARVGLGNPDRPIASFIFSGPTGVGKTELAKTLAASIFGSESAMIRLDLSEYMESHTVAKLIGTPPGYVGYEAGGQLTEAVRRRPYSVVLFDEIEKAHPDIFNLLLQLLDDGRLTDANGRMISFKNTLIIMTSNIGSKVIEKGGSNLGFEFSDNSAVAQYNRIRSLVNEDLKHYFRPEFLNRLDDIIVFRQLNQIEMQQIADLLIQEIATRLEQQGITLEMTEACKTRLVAEGYDPNYGARPLRRAITRLIEDPLAEAILAGQVKAGDTAVMDIDDDGQVQIRQNQSVLVGAACR
ncbi:MAG: ATP-dependent Clp protease ATP-binding subunit [Cyanothece sp. SIO1E1]|nr:ATP-dependent Clp protease ATP-binding subunit [Cyanothece sp. SIO1E1]